MTKQKELLTVQQAARVAKVKCEVLRQHIEFGNVTTVDGLVPLTVCEMIISQKELYIGFKAFLKLNSNGYFDAKYVKNRDKYLDFLEGNDYFGVTRIESREVLFDIPDREDFYFLQEDIPFLQFKSKNFFEEYGLSEQEKVYKYLEQRNKQNLNADFIRKFIRSIVQDERFYTPSFTEFVKIISEANMVNKLTDEDVLALVESTDIQTAKEYIVKFLQFIAKQEKVKYNTVRMKKKEGQPIGAYSYKDFVSLAKILFNEDYDKEHQLTQKALEKSLYAEMWMYLSCHYICGWRSSDICDRWVYLNISDKYNLFNINLNTLKKDILEGNIPKETYEKVALYAIRKIEMSYNIPQKTGIGRLRAEIVPELRCFFGKLMLIAEYHHISSAEGYMKSYRCSLYKNYVMCREFFGDDFFAITGCNHISSRRLNKSYLQGIEKAAIDNGNTTLVASVIAAFARNHASVDTTMLYIKDHGLTGESAEVVLYMMFQRGIFGVSLYNALIAAYPEAFTKLTMKEQTALMEKIPLSSYELETLGTMLDATDRMRTVFEEAKIEEPTDILKSMYSVVNGNGKSKDVGVFCMKKAMGDCCEHPTYESCIANLCPYHIFTSEGIPTLIKVIKEYNKKALLSRNVKYKVALETKIMPAFQNIINEIMKDMTNEEKHGLIRLISEEINGQSK